MLKIIDINNKQDKIPAKSNKINDEDLVIRIADFLINHSILSYKSSIRLTYDETVAYAGRLLKKIQYENDEKVPEKIIKNALDICDGFLYISFENSNPITILKSAIKDVCGGLDLRTALSLVKLRINEKLENKDPVLGQALYEVYFDRINQ